MNAAEEFERIAELRARGAAVSNDEVDELVTLLGSLEWFDRSVEEQTGWYAVPTPLDIVDIADMAEKALAALGGRALVRAAARYDDMRGDVRARVRRLVDEVSVEALAELGASERAKLSADGTSATKRGDWADAVVRARAAEDEHQLRELVVRGVQADTWCVDRAPEIIEHIADRRALADALVDAMTQVPAQPPAAIEALAKTLAHVARELGDASVTKLARLSTFEDAESEARARAVVEALAPALAAGKVDLATRQRMVAYGARLCLEKANPRQALVWASARLPREEVLALVGPALAQRLHGDERQIDDALHRIQGIGREVWPWVPLERLEDIATSPTIRDALRQWAQKTLEAIVKAPEIF